MTEQKQYEKDIEKQLEDLSTSLTNYENGDYSDGIKSSRQRNVLSDHIQRLNTTFDSVRVRKESIDRNIQNLEEDIRELRLKEIVFHASIAANSIANIGGDLLHVNKAFLDLWGYQSQDEVIGSSISDFFLDLNEAAAVMEHIQEKGWWDGQFTGKKKNGDTFISQGYASEICDIDGKFIGYQSTNIDISAQIGAELALIKEKERVQTYLDIAGAIIVVLNPDQTIKLINKKGCVLLGWDVEPVGINWFDTFIPENERKMVSAIFDQLMVGEIELVKFYENSILAKNGKKRYIAWENSILKDETGKLVGTLSSGIDITDRVNAEQEIRKHADEYKQLFDSMTEMFQVIELIYDEDGSVTDYYYRKVNPAFEKLVGKSQDQLLGKRAKELFGIVEDHWLGVYENVDQSGMPIEYENYGEELDKYYSIKAWKIQDKLIGIIFSDITEQEKNKEKIIESEEKFRNIFETSPIGIISVNLKGFVSDANSAFFTLSGFSKDEIINKHFTQIPTLIKQDIPTYVKLVSRILSGKKFASYLDFKWIHKDGKERYGAVGLGLTRIKGKITGIQAIVQDTTEKRQYIKELESISIVADSLLSSTNRNNIIQIVVDQLTRILDAHGVTFISFDPLRNVFILEGGSGVWSDVVSDHVDPDGITAQVINSNETYINNSAKTKPDPRDSTPELLGRVDAVACVPMIALGNSIGVVWIGRTSPFDDQTIRLMNSVINICANAIQRETAQHKTEINLKRLEALHNIETVINSSLDINLTLHILINHVIDQLGVDAANVLLFDDSQKTLSFAAGKGFRSTMQLKKTNLGIGEGFAGQAAQSRKTISALNLSGNIGSSEYNKFLIGEKIFSYIGIPLIAQNSVVGVLEIYNRTQLVPDKDWMDFLETLAEQAAITIYNSKLFDDLQQSNQEVIQGYDQTIVGWARTLEMRDEETEGHSQRVTELTVSIAKELGIEGDELLNIRRGAILHDIGKMAISDSILHKPGKLTDNEWEIMRKHPVYAYDWLSSISFLDQALSIPLYHHEQWDGTGYPEGLIGKDIPIGARIFAIVDVWDALLTDRPYREAWSRKDTIKHIRSQSGTHFDPAVVKTFLKFIKDQ